MIQLDKTEMPQYSTVACRMCRAGRPGSARGEAKRRMVRAVECWSIAAGAARR
jgi:hypothetical protein